MGWRLNLGGCGVNLKFMMGKKYWQRKGAHADIKQVERNTISEKDLSQFSRSLRVTI